ncbi:MAG: class I SAM-dependent methyltransferase [Rhodobacteraceae bacterium]|nr:class I SAM-dependent methyltransferase [Paracoccaceae bacterium]
MPDPQTIRVYDARAAEYAAVNVKDNSSEAQLPGFIQACLPGGHVLDLGCGPGASAAMMAQAGLTVDASDASGEMVALAARHPGVNAFQALFSNISGHNIYDGIWASFCLLHAPRADFPDHLAALHKALKPGGAFYIGMKLGTGEVRDSIGRLYTYYTTKELDSHLTQAGFNNFHHLFGRSKGLDGEMSDYVAILAHG